MWLIGVAIVATVGWLLKDDKPPQTGGKDVNWDYVFDPKWNPNNT